MKAFPRPLVVLAVASLVLIVGCSGGGSAGKSGLSGTGSTSSVTLAQTVMVGGLGNWQWAESDFGAFVPCGGNQETFANCYQTNFVMMCDSGCQPGPFQQAAPGKLRVVLFLGTEDALNICNGRQQYPSDGLQESVRSIQTLYKLQVWLATIPPIVDGQGNPTCTTAVAAVNQEIGTVAKNQGVTLVDLGGALTTPTDYDLTRKIFDIYGYLDYDPSTTGYSAMQSVYMGVAQ